MMSLIILSMVEAVLEAEDLKILFIKSQPVAAVKKINDGDHWEAYQIALQNKEDTLAVRYWLEGYISRASDLRNLDMTALMEIIKQW